MPGPATPASNTHSAPCPQREPFASLALAGADGATPASPARRLAVPYVLPGAVLVLACAALLWHGPILQLAHYHDFADQRAAWGLAHAADVLSNLGFVAVGLLGLVRMRRFAAAPQLAAGRDGWRLFFLALVFTGAGSAAYHLAPDDARLVWDRLPIALACAGLLAATWRETIGVGRWVTPALAALAFASVAWWRVTDLQGAGDLRPYLLLQFLPLVLVPLLQWQHEVDMRERLAVAGAMGLYVLAKGFEWADHAVFTALTVVSGHTIKHVLATLAAVLIGAALYRRVQGCTPGNGKLPHGPARFSR
jgi:hypothetical protein